MNPTSPTSPPAPCCDEYAGLSRRGLLRGGLAIAGAGAVTATFGTTLTSTAYAASGTAPSVLVVVSLRGAADGLSLVVPHADAAYYSARPRTAVPKGALLATDAQFGLHPALAPLLPHWTAGKVAAVHAVGLAAPNRSHFAAMEEVEDADPGSDARVGWLNRLIGRVGVDGRVTGGGESGDPLRGVFLGGTVAPTALHGPAASFAVGSLDDARINGDDEHGSRTGALTELWGDAPGPFASGVRTALRAVREFTPARESDEQPQAGAAYPRSDLGRALAATARTIRADVGAEVVTVDHGSWDMHADAGTLEWGQMKDKAGDLASSLAAFLTDLGPLADRVTVVTVTEFGRRLRENANWGSDHGHGSVMLALGAGVRGGYHGRWPGLVDGADADLPVTTDYRSVLAELVDARFGGSAGTVFPGFRPEPVGVFRAV